MPWSGARKDPERILLGHDVKVVLYRLDISARKASRIIGKSKSFVQNLIVGRIENVERYIELLDAKITGFGRELAIIIVRRKGMSDDSNIDPDPRISE
jgi:hypothetical protein